MLLPPLKPTTPCSVPEYFLVHCSNPSTSSSPGSGADLGSSPYVPFQQHSDVAAKTYLGTGMGYKMPQCKEASGAPVDSSTRGYGWVTAVSDGTRSTWVVASPGQAAHLRRAGGQWGGWGRWGAEGMLGTTCPSMLEQSASEGHSAEMLCYCLPKKKSNSAPGSLVPTSSLPPPFQLFCSCSSITPGVLAGSQLR